MADDHAKQVSSPRAMAEHAAELTRARASAAVELVESFFGVAVNVPIATLVCWGAFRSWHLGLALALAYGILLFSVGRRAPPGFRRSALHVAALIAVFAALAQLPLSLPALRCVEGPGYARFVGYAPPSRAWVNDLPSSASAELREWAAPAQRIGTRTSSRAALRTAWNAPASVRAERYVRTADGSALVFRGTLAPSDAGSDEEVALAVSGAPLALLALADATGAIGAPRPLRTAPGGGGGGAGGGASSAAVLRDPDWMAVLGERTLLLLARSGSSELEAGASLWVTHVSPRGHSRERPTAERLPLLVPPPAAAAAASSAPADGGGGGGRGRLTADGCWEVVPRSVARFDGALWIKATDPEASGLVLFRTDGTAAGTRLHSRVADEVADAPGGGERVYLGDLGFGPDERDAFEDDDDDDAFGTLASSLPAGACTERRLLRGLLWLAAVPYLALSLVAVLLLRQPACAANVYTAALVCGGLAIRIAASRGAWSPHAQPRPYAWCWQAVWAWLTVASLCAFALAARTGRAAAAAALAAGRCDDGACGAADADAARPHGATPLGGDVHALLAGSRWLLNSAAVGYALGVHLLLGLPPADGLAVWAAYNLAAVVLAVSALAAHATFALGLAALVLPADVWRLGTLLADAMPSDGGAMLVRASTIVLVGALGVLGLVSLARTRAEPTAHLSRSAHPHTAGSADRSGPRRALWSALPTSGTRMGGVLPLA
jgi:hypothetical protein